MRGIVLICCLLLGACSAAQPAPLKDVRLPDPIFLVKAKALPDLPPKAEGNAEMLAAYTQCRIAHANEADLRWGLVTYVYTARGDVK